MLSFPFSDLSEIISTIEGTSLHLNRNHPDEDQKREQVSIAQLDSQTNTLKTQISKLGEKLKKKNATIMNLAMARKTMDFEQEKMRKVKVKASDMINKMRKKVNLMIDAVNT